MTAADSAPLTPREAASLNESIRDLNTTIKELKTEMASTYARKDVIEPRLTEMQKDIDAHSDWLTWAQRLLIGAVILALLGVVVSQGGGFG